MKEFLLQHPILSLSFIFVLLFAIMLIVSILRDESEHEKDRELASEGNSFETFPKITSHINQIINNK